MKKLIALALAAIFAFGCASCTNGSEAEPTEDTCAHVATTPPTTIPRAEPEPVPETTIAPLGSTDNPYMPGMYKVGSDLPAGEYLFVAYESSAYVCISSDPNADDILQNEIFDYTFFATLQNGQYVNASRCAFVFASDYTITGNDGGSVSTGMYRVGRDIPAGEYKLSATDGYGYYCIYSSSDVPFDIIKNDLFESSVYVVLEEGQYFSFTDSVAFQVEERGETAETEPKAQFSTTYVLDNASKIFHYLHCSEIDQIEKSNQETVTVSKQELIEKGFSPCGKCRS